jgi:hypothetical protein
MPMSRTMRREAGGSPYRGARLKLGARVAAEQAPDAQGDAQPSVQCHLRCLAPLQVSQRRHSNECWVTSECPAVPTTRRGGNDLGSSRCAGSIAFEPLRSPASWYRTIVRAQ